MDLAALNEIGITLCMALGLAVFYFVGRRNPTRGAGRSMEKEKGLPSSDADPSGRATNRATKELPKEGS